MAYQYHSRKARPIPDSFNDSDAQRFWLLVDKSPGQGPNGECWQWKQACYLEGYGRFSIGPIDNHRNLRAHRVGYMLGHNENPGTLHVLHKCDNRACVRPEHLFLGTARDNRLDCVQKGRQAKGKKVGPVTRSILTPQRVKAFRDAYATGTISQRQLAIIAGMSVRTMCGILNRKTWNYPDCG